MNRTQRLTADGRISSHVAARLIREHGHSAWNGPTVIKAASANIDPDTGAHTWDRHDFHKDAQGRVSLSDVRHWLGYPE